MEKQFVTYEIALKLKELGFDEECIKVYDEKGYLQDEDVMDVLKLIKVLAPLWQQAIDWLREKYDIHVLITVNPYSELNEVNGYKIYMNVSSTLTCILNQETQTWSNYKAREQAILKAIKLCQKQN